MIVRCPKCGRKGRLDDSYTGRRVGCPECAVVFVAEPLAGSEKQTKWYYAAGEDKNGPIDQQTFNSLVDNGTISPETLVWCKGMDSWLPLSEAGMSLISDEVELKICSDCKGSFPPDRMMDHEGRMVCEKCKLALLHEKHKKEESEEGGEHVGGLKAGGLISRFMAKIIDLVFMLAIGGMVEGFSRKLFPESYGGGVNDVFAVTLLINMLLGVFYITWFVGKFGATPGKMVTKLKIVNSNGERIGYRQAFGRYCGEFIVVALTLLIGYLIAIFDKQRRTLHDRLCHTLVVQVR